MDKELNKNGMVATALRIAKSRSALLGKVKDALQGGKDREAIKLMRQYCGMTTDEKGNRPNSRLN